MGDDATFTFTTELAEKFFHLRFQNESLFKKKKQPWKDFHKMLLDKGFPRTMTQRHMSKKWQNTLYAYMEAKSKNNTSWLYYSLFDKYLGNNKAIDKYDSWDEEWRTKLIQACLSCHEKMNTDKTSDRELWRAVENELRSSGLPLECCIQDIRGLFHHLKITYRRWSATHKRAPCEEWARLEECAPAVIAAPAAARMSNAQRRERAAQSRAASHDYVWSHDMTESFIQVRLQHEWLFKERKQPWHDFAEIMVEYGYPKLYHHYIRKKWNTINREFQKALASNNTNWAYYDIFQKYLGDNFSNLDPLQSWQERWVLGLIKSRIRHHASFQEYGSQPLTWRLVEKDLRSSEIPLDHSLLNLPELWDHLRKTFRWKKSFATKGILNEVWPYYNAMEEYWQLEKKTSIAGDVGELEDVEAPDTSDSDDVGDKPLSQTKKVENDGKGAVYYVALEKYLQPEQNTSESIALEVKLMEESDFDDDDIKPLSQINKVDNFGGEAASDVCRACGTFVGGGGSAVWGEEEDDHVATKLSTIAGIEVNHSDSLPDRICVDCLRQLEAAFQFRIKCQRMDRQYRLNLHPIKKEYITNNDAIDLNNDNINNEYDDTKDTDGENPLNIVKSEEKRVQVTVRNIKEEKKVNVIAEEKRKEISLKMNKSEEKRKVIRRRATRMKPQKGPRSRDIYKRVCEICGRNVLNIRDHMLGHTGARSACHKCGKTFKFKSGLVGHMAIHRETPVKVCQICGKSFKQKYLYERHYAYHRDERTYSCDKCGKCFKSSDTLRVHRRIHTEQRPYGCPECGNTFRTAGCVGRHRRIVHKIRTDPDKPRNFKLTAV